MILDEREHAGPVLAEVLSRWLGQAPEARVLVTSRERFGVPGEVPLELAPLDGDDTTALLAARAGLAPSPAIAALAARVDGIPLALELIAPRLHLLAPEDQRPRRHRRGDGSDRRVDREAILAVLDRPEMGRPAEPLCIGGVVEDAWPAPRIVRIRSTDPSGAPEPLV